MPKLGAYHSGAAAALADFLATIRGGANDTLSVEDVLTALSLFSTVSPGLTSDLAVIMRSGAPKLVTLSDVVALATGGSTGHNFLINGAFDVAQRATSYVATTSAAFGCVDRWYMGQATSAAATFSQAAPSPALPGYKNCLKILLTGTSTGQIYFGQPIESIDVSAFQGKTVVLSFYALKGSTWNPASLGVRLITGTGTDQGAASVVAGTWTGQANTLDTTKSPATSWAQYSATVAVPSGATEAAAHFFATPTGAAVDANSYLMIGGIDVRTGNTAPSSRDSRPISQELTLCQRYYRRFNGDASNDGYLAAGYCHSTTLALIPFPLGAGMRVVPSRAFSALGDLVVRTAGGSVALSSLTIGAPAGNIASFPPVLSANVASGFTVGQAAVIYLAAAAGKWFALDAELN